MGCTKGVIFALGTAGEAGKTTRLPQCADTVAPSGENFMRIGLMPHIPDQPVARRVKHIMQRYGQLNHTKTSPQMAAGDRDSADGLKAQFIRHLPQGGFRQFAQGIGCVQCVEKGCLGHWNS